MQEKEGGLRTHYAYEKSSLCPPPPISNTVIVYDHMDLLIKQPNWIELIYRQDPTDASPVDPRLCN